MKKLRDLAVHKGAVAIAVFLSLLTASPQVYFRLEHRTDGVYQGIELLPDSPWSARAREFQDGHGLGSIYYKDGKDNPYIFQPLGSAVVANMGKAFGLDINNTFLLSRLVLPFIAFLLIYSFVLLLSRSRLAALASASALLFAESALSPHGLLALLRGESPRAFLDLSRPVNPLMIYIPFFAFLTAFWLFYRKKDWRWGVASAVLLGLNFYTYFYTWTYLYAFGAFLLLLYALKKNWWEVLRIGSVFTGALIIAIPYGINLYRASQFPTYAEVGRRLGLISSREPLFIGLIALGALIIFLLWFPREDTNKRWFGLALLLAPILTLNQQLLTGKMMQAAHYHWYFHRPMAVIFVLMIMLYWLSRLGWERTRRVLAVLVIAGSVAAGTFVQASSYYREPNDGGAAAVERQKYGPVMTWLAANAEKESTVLGNEIVSRITVIYTPLNVFYHRGGLYSLSATSERLREVFFTFYRLRGVEAKDAREVFSADRALLSWNMYGIYNRDSLGSYEALPEDKFEDLINAYTQTLSIPTAQWLKQVLTKYEVAYIVWDKKTDPSWQLEKYPFLRGAAAFGDISIYRLSHENRISG